MKGIKSVTIKKLVGICFKLKSEKTPSLVQFRRLIQMAANNFAGVEINRHRNVDNFCI